VPINLAVSFAEDVYCRGFMISGEIMGKSLAENGRKKKEFSRATMGNYFGNPHFNFKPKPT
jgi:hypothetical protein